MMIKGKMQYIPANVFKELENIKAQNNINKNAEAFKNMAEFSELGREVKNMMKLNLKDLAIFKKQRR
jgi:hypothetical protein